jgi:hypothetical protein
MIRKFAIAAAAIAALGTASLTASTPAAAWGKGGGFHHFHGGGFRVYSGIGLYDYDSCYRTRLVVNRRGEVVRRVINICD